MRAIVASKPGGPDVLEIVETAEPEVRDGEVKIRVHAFGLNKAESYYRAGNYGIVSPELALGYEAVGEIVDDPSGRMARGQRVATAMGGMMTQRHGGYAEFITVNASNAIPIDSGLEWTELAALPEAYLTVWGALEKSARIAKGQWLLVRGATSSLGLAAVAYAKMLGSDALPLRDAPLDEIANGIAGGGVPSSLAKVFPVEDIRKAHQLLDGGTAGGKIVVTR